LNTGGRAAPTPLDESGHFSVPTGAGESRPDYPNNNLT
jgi:hypothetical protein